MPKSRSKSVAKLNLSLSMLRQRQKLNRCRRKQKPTKSTEKLRWSKCSSKHCQRWPQKSQLHCLRLVLNTFLSSSSEERNLLRNPRQAKHILPWWWRWPSCFLFPWNLQQFSITDKEDHNGLFRQQRDRCSQIDRRSLVDRCSHSRTGQADDQHRYFAGKSKS